MSGVRNVFPLEVIKLLLQVAWADGEVAAEESEALVKYGEGVGLPEAHISELRTYLSGEAPLPPPNLGLLKNRRAEVLRVVAELLHSDLKVEAEEQEILEQIEMLLG